ncbi:penicillin-binding protein [Tenacibaculum agarivorans]|uniref:penicillin-binding protein n=1 Tax=Tenacibaculum agarivorans TaxID=1908389 RepID=UPI00094B80C9|nr:penicillin-binding protein [Tenacibaculum agarivorans]
MSLFLLVVGGRVFELQYVKGEKYKKLALETTIKNDTIAANRGNVYAGDGNLLATSVSNYTIRMDVMSVKDRVFEKNIAALTEELSDMLGRTPKYYEKKLREAKQKRNRYLLIAKNLGYNDYMRMKSFPIFNLGVYRGGFIAERKTVREHPIGKIAERTVGYSDHRGGAGIEGAFSDYMEGKNGWRLKQKIAKGQWKPLSDTNEKEPEDGKDVITTIDVNMQDITHYALLKQLEYFEADHGCAVVMETATGEIKAISNLGRTSNGRYYEKRNYAVWESHEPGSTFKLASLMAALEDKVVDTSEVVDTEKGKIFINNKKVEDSQWDGYGKISLARVFEVSSNVGIVKTIQKHYDRNPEKFLKRIRQFGLDQQTGVKIVGEGEPFIPTPKGKSWSPIALEWMSWGYGVSLTPLQILMFYNAVANNGELVKPRFVKALKTGGKTVKEFDKVVVKKRIAKQITIDKVTKVMENVVKKGTAKDIYSPNFSMAGKTGTAKKFIPRRKNSKGEWEGGYYSNQKYVASFAGFFPVEEPEYSCIVVIHEPDPMKGYYGAKVAAPVFKEIAHKIYTSTPSSVQKVTDSVVTASISKDYNSYYTVLNKYKTIMPRVVGMSAMDAISILENMGLKVKISGVGKVMEQSINKGEKITKGATVYLKLS